MCGIVTPSTGVLIADGYASRKMIEFLVLPAVTFSLFGFIIGIWANGFGQLQFIPTLVVTPLVFWTFKTGYRLKR